ncbi:MAG: gamma-glutamyl-gamma-aminobutyrate hydrolase family protein [Bacillota bacterium]
MAEALIGISVSCDYEQQRYWLPRAYCRRVAAAGGVPLLLPAAAEDKAAAVVARLDGLILSGGGDISPLFYGAEPQPGLGEVDPWRDAWEIRLAQEALRRDLPLLGICRGLQVLNVALGGGIIQDLCGQAGLIQHDQKAPRCSPTHTVRVLAATRLAALAGEGVLAVNSFHHQAAATIADGLRVSALAPDGVTEALESPAHRLALAVQWHPECLEHPASYALFDALLHPPHLRPMA